MARQIKIDDQEKKELEAWERTQSRSKGFEMMHIRDQGCKMFDNGVRMIWHVDRELMDGEARDYVPAGNFVLEIKGKKYPFNVDEFRRWLRWA